MQCKYGPEGITWVNQKAGLGLEAAGKCLLQYFGPRGPRDSSELCYWITTGLFMTTGRELGPLGTGLLCELLLSGLHVHPVVLIPVPPISVFTLLHPNASPLHVQLSRSACPFRFGSDSRPPLMPCPLYFSVDVTLA